MGINMIRSTSNFFNLRLFISCITIKIDDLFVKSGGKKKR
jgi:hypothetical protein